jgi:hypothetical protein
MPRTQPIKKHFTGSEVVRDIVIGISDGLTIPFALAVGLSGVHTRPPSSSPKAWIDFMMRFELGLEKPDPRRALRSALQTALIGGLAATAAFGLTRLISK